MFVTLNKTQDNNLSQDNSVQSDSPSACAVKDEQKCESTDTHCTPYSEVFQKVTARPLTV